MLPPVKSTQFPSNGPTYTACLCGFKGAQEMAFIAPNADKLREVLDAHGKTYNPDLFQRVIIIADPRFPRMPVTSNK